MKLSQNLLGLAGLAVADYACCPYDDYGIVDGDCGLTEKTPFNVPLDATDDWNNNMCKAWESNVDATYDGNDNDCPGYDNWGGCGFQRHFAWGQQVALDSVHSSLTFDTVASGTDLANGLASPAASQSRSFDDGTDDNKFKVGGVPFLGGICKLFIPVLAEHIEQVTIAGVHVNAGQAQFPATVNSNTGAAEASSFVGTAYCFSVVNIAEFKTNTNEVANGNVAGDAAQLLAGNTYTGLNDIFAGATSLQRQAGRNIGAFGDAATDFSAIDQGDMVEGGANFDVVAHFSSTQCQSVWNDVDMQLAGDVGEGGDIDYPTTPDNTFSHAHTDLKDKRHKTPAIAYRATGNYAAQSDPSPYLVGDVRWPNFGAWAGFNSFIACANKDDSADPAIPTSHWLHGGQARVGVMSVGTSDFRSKKEGVACNAAWAEFQFNLRQIGTEVIVCGPGELPDTDNNRCTWNWNYDASAGYGSSSDTDPEGFFDRNENMDFAVWSRKRRDAVNRDTAAPNQPVNAAANLGEPVFTFSFKNYKNNAVTATLTQLSDEADANNGFLIATNTVTVKCTNPYTSPTGNQRDLFPTCFVGDEIHLKATYTPDTTNDGNRAFISPWLSEVTSAF